MTNEKKTLASKLKAHYTKNKEDYTKFLLGQRTTRKLTQKRGISTQY